MDTQTTIICLLVVAAIVAAIYFVSGHTTTDNYCGEDMITSTLPTSPEVEYIQGHSDMHDGIEIIPQGDIAMGPRF